MYPINNINYKYYLSVSQKLEVSDKKYNKIIIIGYGCKKQKNTKTWNRQTVIVIKKQTRQFKLKLTMNSVCTCLQ